MYFLSNGFVLRSGSETSSKGFVLVSSVDVLELSSKGLVLLSGLEPASKGFVVVSSAVVSELSLKGLVLVSSVTMLLSSKRVPLLVPLMAAKFSTVPSASGISAPNDLGGAWGFFARACLVVNRPERYSATILFRHSLQLFVL